MLSKGVALVTGASQGIGRAIALRLAHDGFDIAVNDIARGRPGLEILTKEITAKGRKSVITIADVSSEREVKDMTEEVVQELGGLDVVSPVHVHPFFLCHIRPI